MKLHPFSVFLSSLAVQGVLGATLRSRQEHEHHDEPHDHASNGKPALEAKYFKEFGAKRVRITYGPFLVPSVADSEYYGMKDWTIDNSQMPCKDCLITGFNGGLEFTDGSNANANGGMWMHHAVFVNLNRTDTTCPRFPDRFIGAGNERTPIDLTVGGTHKAGYYLGKQDQIQLGAELMNEAQEAREAIITTEWEYVPGIPDGFDIAQSVWLDVTGLCGNSQYKVNVTDKPFHVSMNQTWSPNFTGTILSAMPHVHDGAVKQEFYVDGKLACNTVVNYGETAEFISHVGMFGSKPAAPPETEEHDHPHAARDDDPPHEHEHEEEEHEHEHEEEEAPGHDHNSDEHILRISSLTYCTNMGKIGPENKLSITSYYDMSEHSGMASHHDGGVEPVMGIQVAYVARPKEEALKEIEANKGPESSPLTSRPREGNPVTVPAL